MPTLEYLRLSGTEIKDFGKELAQLRIEVFRDWPYLYQGSLDYEMGYLETYFRSPNSFVLLVKDGDRAVGATTGILAQDEEESFRAPFVEYGLDPRSIFYFGESVLLTEYRGLGVGKRFFEERQSFAKTLGNIKTLAFCAVVRDENDPRRPPNYRPLDGLWRAQGFEPAPGLVTNYEWTDIGESAPSTKPMQFWIKQL